ncbi:CbtA family protein, partial [Ameyamaea chiangmaiensis]
MGRLLARGMIAGVLAACLAFAFARLFGEPQVALSIAFEAARD